MVTSVLLSDDILRYGGTAEDLTASLEDLDPAWVNCDPQVINVVFSYPTDIYADTSQMHEDMIGYVTELGQNYRKIDFFGFSRDLGPQIEIAQK